MGKHWVSEFFLEGSDLTAEVQNQTCFYFGNYGVTAYVCFVRIIILFPDPFSNIISNFLNNIFVGVFLILSLQNCK